VQDLKKRTKDFALDIVRSYSTLPRRMEVFVLAKQLLRSGTSVGAQYREACRAKSNADFISKVEGALQELEESMYWLELLTESGHMSTSDSERLMAETRELTAIFTSVTKTVKSRAGAR